MQRPQQLPMRHVARQSPPKSSRDYSSIPFILGSIVLALVDSGHIQSAVVRVALGLVVGGFGCGYTVAGTLFGNHLSGVQRYALAITFSVAILVLASLGLSETHTPVTSSSLSDITAGVTVIAGLGGLVGRRAADPPATNGWSAVLAVLATAGLALVVLALVQPNLNRKTPAFYVTDLANQQTNYPSSIVVHTNHDLRLHLTHATGGYRIRIRNGSQLVDTGSIHLRSDHPWSELVRLPDRRVGPQTLDLSLYRVGEARPFRTLRLFYTVKPPPGANPPVGP